MDTPKGRVCTTLNRVKSTNVGNTAMEKLLAYLGKTESDDEPLPYATILTSNGLDDALWCCRAEPQHAPIWRKFAVVCAERTPGLPYAAKDIDAAWHVAWYAAERAARLVASKAARSAINDWEGVFESFYVEERAWQAQQFLKLVG